MDVSSDDVRTLLVKWCHSRQSLYAVIFEATAIQAVTGHVTNVADGFAIITDDIAQLRIPISEPMDYALTVHEHEVKSITLTWPDGKSAFIVTRAEMPPDAGPDIEPGGH